MYKRLLFLIIFFSGISGAKSQDVITLKTGEELKARIIRLNQEDVTFLPESSNDTVFLHRSDITKLTYQSGIIIQLSEDNVPVLSDAPISDSMYVLGERDALRYYRGYIPAGTGTLIASYFVPWGLIPAIACSKTRPGMQTLGYRDQQLIQNPSYFAGYTDKAFEIKKKKVWKNFAIGSGVTLGLYMGMILLVSSAF